MTPKESVAVSLRLMKENQFGPEYVSYYRNSGRTKRSTQVADRPRGDGATDSSVLTGTESESVWVSIHFHNGKEECDDVRPMQ
jgi:hypothetical protein